MTSLIKFYLTYTALVDARNNRVENVAPIRNAGIELMDQGNEVIAPAVVGNNEQNNEMPENVVEGAGPSRENNEAPMGKMQLL